MNWQDSAVLGLLQAVTEFLPISSSGHLVLGKNILGLSTPGTVMEVVLHMGTLLSILIYYWKDVSKLAVRFCSKSGGQSRFFVFLIAVATVPAIVIGFGFETHIDELYSNPRYLWVVSFALIFSGMVLFFTKYLKQGTRCEPDIRSAILIGLAQSLAILPGISRSGLTISTGLYLGLNREEAARFSFLMAIPVLFGAGLLKLKEIPGLLDGSSFAAVLIGFITSAAGGVCMVILLVKMLTKQKFWMFSIYCWIVGLLSLVL